MRSTRWSRATSTARGCGQSGGCGGCSRRRAAGPAWAADRHQGPGADGRACAPRSAVPLFRDNVPAKDARLVAAIRAAGAIVVGKTNTPEFGAGANTRNAVYGATGNPFDPAKSCAGSSGGSAVALATGMVPICQGSDTGGSLRNPAAFCGVVGFRPTPGLVPTERRPHGWSGLPVVGPMGRTVADTALLLSGMIGDDAGDPLATTVHGKTVRQAADFYPPARIELAGLRVALTPDFGFAPTEQHIASVFAEKTSLFRHVFAKADDASPRLFRDG